MKMRASRRAERAALIALIVTVLMTAAKLAVWATTSSLAVLSQALDSALDIVMLGLLFLGIRIADKPADESHHYGHAKADNLVAFLQTLFLGAVAIGIVLEASRRLGEEPATIDVPWYALVVLAASTVVDVMRVSALTRVARAEESDALKAGAVNLATDLATAVVVLSSLLLVRAGIEEADPIGGLLVAVGVAAAATRLGKRSVDVLMDRAPQTPAGAIEAAAASAPGVAETRRVRVRTTGKQLFADVTVATGRTSSLERAHDVAEGVEREIERIAPGTDVVVHVEPTSETTGLVERAQAAASRMTGVHEVHNVAVHSYNEDGRAKLHVTLHAKVKPGMSLEDAHALSEKVEEEVAQELGPDVRVDTHIEPLETTTSFGKDVTSHRDDVVEAVRRAALAEPDVVDCHEVLVTSAEGVLSVVAHVRGRSDLPLTRLHDASVRIEHAVHESHPELGPVLIHFEPS